MQAAPSLSSSTAYRPQPSTAALVAADLFDSAVSTSTFAVRDEMSLSSTTRPPRRAPDGLLILDPEAMRLLPVLLQSLSSASASI